MLSVSFSPEGMVPSENRRLPDPIGEEVKTPNAAGSARRLTIETTYDL